MKTANNKNFGQLQNMAKQMRINAIKLAYKAGENGAHLGGGLSPIEILAVLYGKILSLNPEKRDDPERDRFVLSKGHGTLAYYTALYEAGLISREELFSFEDNGGPFPGHPVRNLQYGIECSGGSLGTGISVAVGLALAAKIDKRRNKIYTLVGDGECNEGAVWEAAMSAVHYGLNNLIVIVDRNGLQSDGRCDEVFHTAPLENIWRGFGWDVEVVDGHKIEDLVQTLEKRCDSPKVVIANTVKGKGISFMENLREWHHSTLNEKQYLQALQELGAE
ncbi:MAG: transketolase [Peptococcaceae bacterium]|nr:transketolase [Peptococcaceae bacterium]